VIDIEGTSGTYTRVPLSEYISEVEYIPLETHPDALIGEYRHLMVTPTRIFVAGSDFCYAFTREGRFVTNIGQAGRGPGEYTSMTGLSVDEERELIWLDTVRDLLEYTWDGRLVRTIPKPVTDPAYGNRPSAYHLGDGTFLGHTPNLSGREPHSWIIVDNEWNVLSAFPQHIRIENEPQFASLSILGASRPFVAQGEAWLSEYTNDTLYHLTRSRELVPAFVFNTGRYRYRHDVYLDRNNALELSRGAVYLNVLHPMVFAANDIFFSVLVGYNLHSLLGLPEGVPGENNDTATLLGIYDIRGGKTYLLDRDPVSRRMGLVNDLDGGLSFWPEYGSGDELTQVLSAFDMKEILTEEYFAAHPAKDPAAHAKLRELLGNLKEDSNPVIVFAKLKQ
jgi:hypothetical protein